MGISNKIDPRLFGLSSRTVLKKGENNGIVLVMRRKSRILMKDGEKILRIRNLVMNTGEYTSFTLQTNAPVCSKTRKFLESSGIRIET